MSADNLSRLFAAEPVTAPIVWVHGHKAIIDSDLSVLLHIPIDVLRDEIKNNLGKFPENFLIQLSDSEMGVAQQGQTQGGVAGLPTSAFAFSELGALMAAKLVAPATAIPSQRKVTGENTQPATRLGTVAIRRSIPKVIRTLALFIVLVAGSILFILHSTPSEKWKAWLCLAFFAPGVPVFIIQLFDTKPRLIISDYGIYDRTLKVGTIPWSDITGAYIKSVRPTTVDFICLELRNPDFWYEKILPVRRAMVEFNFNRGFAMLNVNLSNLAIGTDEAFKLILDRIASTTTRNESLDLTSEEIDEASKSLVIDPPPEVNILALLRRSVFLIVCIVFWAKVLAPYRNLGIVGVYATLIGIYLVIQTFWAAVSNTAKVLVMVMTLVGWTSLIMLIDRAEILR